MDRVKSPQNWMRMKKCLFQFVFLYLMSFVRLVMELGLDPSMSQYLYLDVFHLIGMYFS